MVGLLGFDSLDALIDATVPASIRREGVMELANSHPDGITESAFIKEFRCGLNGWWRDPPLGRCGVFLPESCMTTSREPHRFHCQRLCLSTMSPPSHAPPSLLINTWPPPSLLQAPPI